MVQFRKIKSGAACGVSILVVGLMALSACAPEDLDYTPTAPPPTLTLTPTPASANNGGGETPTVDANAAQVDAIIASLPSIIPAEDLQWRIDRSRGTDGFETPPNIQNGAATRIYYGDSGGYKMYITFAVFVDPAAAEVYYERILGIRDDTVLKNGIQFDNFPTPNLFGPQSTTGSVSILRNENFFIEVFIESYSSRGDNPLEATTRQAVNILNAGITRYNSPDLKPARMEAITAVLPAEFTIGSGVWERDASQDYAAPLEAGENGLAIRGVYRNGAGGEATFTYTVFDTLDDATAFYSESTRANLSTTLRLNPAGQGQTRDDFPQPNVFGSSVGYIAGGVFQSNDVFVVQIALDFTALPEGDPLPDLAQQALAFLEQSLATTSGEAPAEGTPVPNVTEAPTPAAEENAATPEATQQIIG